MKDVEQMEAMKMEWTEYKALAGMNASTLVHGLKSMRALKRAIDGEQDPPTDAMTFGQIYHSMILEPGDFLERYAVAPDFARDPQNITATGKRSYSSGTKFVKESKRQWEEENAGLLPVTPAQYHRALNMVRNVDNDSFAHGLVSMLDHEVTLLGEIGGVQFKGRVDLIGGDTLADLKGCADVSPRAFGNDCVRFNYWFKLAIYRELARQNGHDVSNVYLIAVETDGDFDVCVYDVPEAVLDEGRRQVHSVLQRYHWAMKHGVWSGVNDGQPHLPLYVPNWAMPDDDLDWGA